MQIISNFIVFTVLCSCALTVRVKFDEQWRLWKETHHKQYTIVEEPIRYTIWKDNLRKVEEHNSQADRGLHTYWLGMNKYADMVSFDLKYATILK